MSEWRTIETAPKDGKCIIGLTTGATGLAFFHMYFDGKVWRDPALETIHYPTHWKPNAPR